MNTRLTIILLIVFAALGSYYVFVERDKPDVQETERLARAVFQIERIALEPWSLAMKAPRSGARRTKTAGRW